jgi:hypothetical protein
LTPGGSKTDLSVVRRTGGGNPTTRAELREHITRDYDFPEARSWANSFIGLHTGALFTSIFSGHGSLALEDLPKEHPVNIQCFCDAVFEEASPRWPLPNNIGME